MYRDNILKQMDVLKGETDQPGTLVLVGYSLKYLEIELEEKLPEKAKLSHLIKDPGNLAENLLETFAFLEKEFPDLKGVYHSLDIDWVRMESKVLFELFLLIYKEDSMDFTKVVYNIRDFIMINAGKQGGESLTPNFLNQLMVSVLDIKEYTSFYDGVSGYGGSLIEVRRQHPEKTISLYGQEINPQAWAISKLSLLMTGSKNAYVERGNTLTEPKFLEQNRLKKFDYIAMNIPFGLKVNNHDHEAMLQDSYHRFSMGDLPKSSSDMAFIQHALSSLTEKGRAVITTSTGVLFRGGAEGAIRQNLIDTDQIEAVIALSSNLLVNTAIPINLLLLNKNKPAAKRKKIQFIQASTMFEERGRTRYLSQEQIDKISKTVASGLEEKNFSKLVSLEDLDETLIVSRYIQDILYVREEAGTYRIHFEQLQERKEEFVALKKLGKTYRGLNITSKNSEEKSAGNFKLIKLSDVQNGKILMDNLSNVQMKTNIKSDLYRVQEGDVIVSSRGAQIKIAVVPKHEGDILLSSNFIGFRPADNKLEAAFLQAYFESPVGHYQLNNSMSGTAVSVLNPKNFESLEIPLPAIEIQKKVSARYTQSIEAYEAALMEAKKKLDEEKERIYQEMGIINLFEVME